MLNEIQRMQEILKLESKLHKERFNQDNHDGNREANSRRRSLSANR